MINFETFLFRYGIVLKNETKENFLKELDKRDQIKGLKKERKEALASFDKQFKKIMKEW